jgi:hypothetical protein
MAVTVRRDFLAARASSGETSGGDKASGHSQMALTGPVLIHTSMISLLVLALGFHEMGDEYLLAFTPWVIWTLGRSVPFRARPALVFAAGTALVQLAGVALWVDAITTREQLQWQAAQNAVHRFGVPPVKVCAGWTWAGYYAFNDYLAHFGTTERFDFDKLFHDWLPDVCRQAEYKVATGFATGPAPGDIDILSRRTLSGRVIEAHTVRVPSSAVP